MLIVEALTPIMGFRRTALTLWRATSALASPKPRARFRRAMHHLMQLYMNAAFAGPCRFLSLA
jgi:hypothetical protein